MSRRSRESPAVKLSLGSLSRSSYTTSARNHGCTYILNDALTDWTRLSWSLSARWLT